LADAARPMPLAAPVTTAVRFAPSAGWVVTFAPPPAKD
jgi:hypothetical protein